MEFLFYKKYIKILRLCPKKYCHSRLLFHNHSSDPVVHLENETMWIIHTKNGSLFLSKHGHRHTSYFNIYQVCAVGIPKGGICILWTRSGLYSLFPNLLLHLGQYLDIKFSFVANWVNPTSSLVHYGGYYLFL